MTADPAIAAAQRYWQFVDPHWTGEDDMGFAIASGAAREALAPLRAKHQKVQRPDGTFRCTNCRDAYGAHADWPTGTDRLIYPEDEL